jgi:hypothetical protein
MEIKICGTAIDCKISAALQLPDGLVYCLQWSAWPEGDVGTIVTVQGSLQVSDDLRVQVAADGAISQGFKDEIITLQDAERCR